MSRHDNKHYNIGEVKLPIVRSSSLERCTAKVVATLATVEPAALRPNQAERLKAQFAPNSTRDQHSTIWKECSRSELGAVLEAALIESLTAVVSSNLERPATSDLRKVRDMYATLQQLLQAFALRLAVERPDLVRSEFTRLGWQINSQPHVWHEHDIAHQVRRLVMQLDFTSCETLRRDDGVEACIHNIQAWPRNVLRSDAFQWLITAFKQELKQYIPGVDDQRHVRWLDNQGYMRWPDDQRTDVFERVFEATLPGVDAVAYVVHWDLQAFLEKQTYIETPAQALAGAITLTGTSHNAQALTCQQYIRQTWPCSGGSTLSLLQKVVDDKRGTVFYGQWSDQTSMSAFIEEGKLCVGAVGVSSSLAELAEQLAWIGAALQTSEHEGLVACKGILMQDTDRSFRHRDNFRHGHFSSRLHDCAMFDLKFQVQNTQGRLSGPRRGTCWHNMFRFPVLATGFPISRRKTRHPGVEMPLSMMSRLVAATSTYIWHSTMFLRGFASMLIPSDYENGVIVWHHLYNADGSRISHLQQVVTDVPQISYNDLEISTHIVGWCQHAKSLVGHYADVSYELEWSGLKPPESSIFVQNISVSGGKFLTAGGTIALGVKDRPTHILTDYPGHKQKVVAAARQYVVLWDVQEARGWLINQNSAVLHLTRAYIHEKNADPMFREHMGLQPTDLREPQLQSGRDYCFEVLMDEDNLRRELFQNSSHRLHPQTTGESSKEVCLRDHFEELYKTLYKMTDSLIEMRTRQGWKLPKSPGEQLLGWDFMDVAEGGNKILPRIVDLPSSAVGWVGLVRAIDAPVLFGKGFGDLFRASGSACAHESVVPPKKNYLAVLASDLAYIARRSGGLQSDPMVLAPGIHWHSPLTTFNRCHDILSDRILNAASDARVTKTESEPFSRFKKQLRNSTRSLGMGPRVATQVLYNRPRASSMGPSRRAAINDEGVYLLEQQPVRLQKRTTLIKSSAKNSGSTIPSNSSNSRPISQFTEIASGPDSSTEPSTFSSMMLAPNVSTETPVPMAGPAADQAVSSAPKHDESQRRNADFWERWRQVMRDPIEKYWTVARSRVGNPHAVGREHTR